MTASSESAINYLPSLSYQTICQYREICWSTAMCRYIWVSYVISHALQRFKDIHCQDLSCFEGRILLLVIITAYGVTKNSTVPETSTYNRNVDHKIDFTICLKDYRDSSKDVRVEMFHKKPSRDERNAFAMRTAICRNQYLLWDVELRLAWVMPSVADIIIFSGNPY